MNTMVPQSAMADSTAGGLRDAIVASLLETGGGQGDLVKAAERILRATIEAWQNLLCDGSARQVEADAIRVSADLAQFFVARHAGDGVILTAQAEGLAHPLVIGLAKELVLDLIEVALGGDGSEAPFRPQRDLSALERELARHVGGQLLGCLEAVLSRGGTAFPDLEVKVLDKDAPVDKVGLKDCAMVGAVFNLDIGNVSHGAVLCLPRDIIEDIVKAFAASQDSDVRTDPEWSGKLAREVNLAPVDIEACLDGGELTLQRLTRLRAGDVLQLPARENNLVNLSCNGTALMKCKLGQAHGRFHVRVENFVADEDRIIQTIAGASPARNKLVSGND